MNHGGTTTGLRLLRRRPEAGPSRDAGTARTRTVARPTLAAYAMAAAATSLGALAPDDRLHAATKYLVAPLAALDVAARPGAWSAQRRPTTLTLLGSLAGSALGDHLMLAESRTDGAAARAHMRLGAAAFAVQQLGFLGIMHARGQRFSSRRVSAGAGLLAALAALDHLAAHREREPQTAAPGGASPSAPSGAVPSPLPDPVVATYGALLVAMGVLAQSDDRTALGGRLFLASDALIVARQLVPHGPWRRLADATVMATYTAALELLVDALADDAPRSAAPAPCVGR